MQRSTPLSKAVLALLVGCVVMVDGCASRDAHQTMAHNFQAPQGFPKVLAVYMPWFGDHSHMDVGYSSQDPEVLRRQVDEARGMGISAFVVDWYGDRSPFLDRSFALLQQVACQKHFQVALMYDQPGDESVDATEDAIAALDKAYRAYIGPGAPCRNAYFTYQGRPMVFIFPKHGRINWHRVREHVDAWSAPPWLIYKDALPAEFGADLDGLYPWVHPGRKGWVPDGSDWGKQYLEDFYKEMTTRYQGKIAVGAAWPGFDDTRARWGLNRHMDARCGKTFEETLQLPHQYYNDSNPLPLLLIETWNDYEEGTAIERRVPGNCAG